MVRNLKHCLLNTGPAAGAEPVVEQNGNAQHKRRKVAVLISGTGELASHELSQNKEHVVMYQSKEDSNFSSILWFILQANCHARQVQDFGKLYTDRTVSL